MNTRKHGLLILAATLILLVGALPPAAYWLIIGSIPTVVPDEARRRLALPGGRAVLVDVRTEGEYASRHIEGAVNWPLDQIMAAQPGTAGLRTGLSTPVPPQLAGRELLLICAGGGRSAMATRHLRAVGVPEVYNVRGGMQEWVSVGLSPCPVNLAAPHFADGQGLPYRASPRYEQFAAIFTGFGVKPVYMLGALALVALLWRQRETDLAALRWAMIVFFLGELFCLLNYAIYGERSYLFEYLHGYGMALTFAFTTYALLEGVDHRLIHYSDPAAKCAATTLCRGCIKHADVPCGLRRVFLLMAPAAGLVALVPLCGNLRHEAYNTHIYGTLYTYSHAVIYQVFEVRVLPVVAFILLLASFFVLLCEKHPARASKLLLAAGLGAMSYSYFRFIFLNAFADNQVWFATWEELTELLYVGTAAGVLLIFRHSLLARRPQLREPTLTPASPGE